MSYTGYTCAETKTSRSLTAVSQPTLSARPKEKSSFAMWTTSQPNRRAMSTVESVEPLSTRISWSGCTVWWANPESSRPMWRSSLRARMTTLVVG